MEILAKLFGGPAKVKIIRLFLLNPARAFDAVEVCDRAKVSGEAARREIASLEQMRLVKRRSFVKETVRVRNGREIVDRRRVSGWILNDRFAYRTQLEDLLVRLPPLTHEEVLAKLVRVGKVKLLIIAGALIREPDSRVDLLVVGDNLKNGALESAVRVIESEVGTEVRYAAFETEQFRYRLNMYDKLVRDILDYRHEVVLDRLGVTRERGVSWHGGAGRGELANEPIPAGV